MRFVAESAQDELEFDINVIPLIDVLLVLLVFFMTSASFVASGGMDVKLPESTSRSGQKEGKSLAVKLSADGVIQADGKTIAGEDLAGFFTAVASQPDKPLIVLRADEHAQHGMVVRVLDAAKSAGLDDIAIATVPRTESTAAVVRATSQQPTPPAALP